MSKVGHIHYIDTENSVSFLAAAISQASRVAIDTEADSLHHYFEKVCLIQLTIGEEDYIVDPLAPLKLAPVLKALETKPLILHGADYDLRMMRRAFGFKAKTIFDTMSAAQLLGYQKFSLAALVERHFGVVLCKQGQKADWSRRPIPEKLIDYAAHDTHFLERLEVILGTELEKAGRLAWHKEICAKLLSQIGSSVKEAPDVDRQWRIKGWHGLKSKRAHAILREIWKWRDAEARQRDLPPFKIIGNESLIEIASTTHTQNSPEPLPKLPRNITGRKLKTLKEALAQAFALPETGWPKSVSAPKSETFPPDENVLAALKKIRDEAAKETGMDPGVLLPGAALASLATVRPRTIEDIRKLGALFDWQVDMFGERFLLAIQNPPKIQKKSPKVENVIVPPVEAAVPVAE